MATISEVHPFEKAGLGVAPFRYVGMIAQEISYGERVIGSAGGVPITTKPGGTCDFCGAYIVNMFQVESSDGNRFKVGCDCIKKVDAKLTKSIAVDVKKMKAIRERQRIADAKAALPKAYKLQGQPHPAPYHAADGKTLANYVEWLLANGGTAGKLRACRMVEAAIAPVVEE